MADGALQYANVAPPESEHPAPAESSVPPLPDSPVTHEATEVPVEQHKAGLPQLNVETFAGQLFWLAVSLILLFFVVWRLGAPKIGGVIAAREGRIKGDIDAAAEAKRRSEEALAGYEKALADARGRALKIGDEMRKKSQDEADAKNAAEAQREAADMAKAEARIGDMRKTAMANVSGVAVEVASDIIAKLTGEVAPANDVSAAVAKTLKRA